MRPPGKRSFDERMIYALDSLVRNEQHEVPHAATRPLTRTRLGLGSRRHQYVCGRPRSRDRVLQHPNIQISLPYMQMGEKMYTELHQVVAWGGDSTRRRAL